MRMYLRRLQSNLLARAIFRNTACTSATQANLHDSQHCLHVNKDCKNFATLLACFFLQRSLRMFFATALACFFLQPKLRGLGRMATCAGVGFPRTVNYFFLPVFFCLTNSTGCCIITVPIRENPIRASTEIGMCRAFYTCFS